MRSGPLGRVWVPDEVRRRLPVEFPVTLDGEAGQRCVGTVVNLSPTGLYVASRTLFAPGTTLRASFALPLAAGPRPVAVWVQVRWLNDPASPQAAELPGGMGVEFVGLDPRLRADIERLLDELTAPPP
ncbi:MAG TPA: PilZ domain-containing protein [Thermodesulfobacteriota bacterium]|nr:PilZ domain-containing protein [Thermodesulfobacteriota bacterium]